MGVCTLLGVTVITLEGNAEGKKSGGEEGGRGGKLASEDTENMTI